MELTNLQKDVEKLMLEAGNLMLNTKISAIEEKGDVANIVTDIDIKVQNFLIAGLKKLLPASSFLAEEEGINEVSDEYLWIIDPIDGTTNYSYDFKHSAISIALLHKEVGIMGLVYNPYLREFFSAIKGEGAYLNGTSIHVTNYDLKSSLIMCGTCPYEKQYAKQTFDTMKELYLSGRDIRRSGSAVLDLCYIASGRCDAFYEHHLSPWDFAAGSIIIFEAGGVVESINEDFDYHKRIGILAGNHQNIGELRKIVNKNL